MPLQGPDAASVQDMPMFAFRGCVSDPSHPPCLHAEHSLGLPHLPLPGILSCRMVPAHCLPAFPEPTLVLWWQSAMLLPSSCLCPARSCLPAVVGPEHPLSAVCSCWFPVDGLLELLCQSAPWEARGTCRAGDSFSTQGALASHSQRVYLSQGSQTSDSCLQSWISGCRQAGID